MFSTLDWTIIISFLIFSFVAGSLMTKKAGESITSYFVANRSLPWWWLGTSMVATTFSADTPLAITGIVANNGVSGNWFWWSWVFTYVTMTFFMAKNWHSSKVLTDVELTELRYEGRPAAWLRGFKAFFLSVIINCIILGWVFRALSKITNPFIHWNELLGENNFQLLINIWPSFLIFDDINNTITVLVVLLIIVLYSSLGGIQGVIFTDLFQFGIAMGASILFACFAVYQIGGLDNLYMKLHEIYPEKAGSIMDFFPSFSNGWEPLQIFLIYIGVQWWVLYFSDGSGYYAQRMNTAKSAQDAEKGAFWFTLANFSLRTWPWIIIALVSLVIFPLDDPTLNHPLGQEVADDREMAYPILMKMILPSGLLGLMFASLIAAFMSTVDTHINWSASYVVNDLYKRFLKPGANDKELVWVSRLCVVFISVLSVLAATQIQSIEKAWKFIIALSAGMGITHLLRWFWWRANAWTEISGMITAFIISCTLSLIYPDMKSEYNLVIIASVTLFISLLVTLLTKPVSKEKLLHFISLANPVGFWNGMVINHKVLFRHRFINWILGVIITFSALFGIGYLLFLKYLKGMILLVLFGLLFWYLIKRINKDE